MPYVTTNNKTVIDPALQEIITMIERSEEDGFHEIDCGNLNYILTRIIMAYWKKGGRYKHINDIVGAMDCATKEFYRRVAVPYEKKKAKQNGDVYNYLKNKKQKCINNKKKS
jgi:hypothetical protein